MAIFPGPALHINVHGGTLNDAYTIENYFFTFKQKA